MREPLWDEGQANRQRMAETAEYLREERRREALKPPSTEIHLQDLERIKGEIRREREEWTQEREEAARNRRKEMEEEEQRRLEAFRLQLRKREKAWVEYVGRRVEDKIQKVQKAGKEEGTQTTGLSQEPRSGVFFSPDPHRAELLSAGDRVTQPGIFIPFGEFNF